MRATPIAALLLLLVPTASAAATLDVRGYHFAPLRLEVAPGESVTVANADDEPHAMRDVGGAVVLLPIVEAHANASFSAPTTPGEYAYYCPFHTSAQNDTSDPQFMRGVLVVKGAAPSATATQETPSPTPTRTPSAALPALALAVAAALALRRRRA